MSTKLEIAKKVIHDNYFYQCDKDPCYKQEMNAGIFDTPNWCGDVTSELYCCDNLIIRACYVWAYFEVLGLSDSDFAELKKYYNKLRDRIRLGLEDN